MQLKSFSFKTSDGTELWVNRWIPDQDVEIKGLVQLNHGMQEHSLRYDRLGSILAENGYVLNAFDMRGHGKTAEIAQQKGKGKLGKIANHSGAKLVIKDLSEVIQAFKNEYPGKKIALLGHSFGSFVSQGYIEKYHNTLDGVILSGTAGPRRMMIGAAKVLCRIIQLFKGPDKTSRFLDVIAFGSYNAHIKNPATTVDWLSKDKMIVQMYNLDQWCGNRPSVSFYKDMMCLLSMIHKPGAIRKIRKELPVYFIYGTEDPVGDYGKSVENLIGIYKNNGMTNIEYKAYKNDRHEVLNETDKEKVEKDVLTWLSKTLTE